MKTRCNVCVVENAHINHLLAHSPQAVFSLFSSEEQRYCLERKRWITHLAARLAAKIAVSAILGVSTDVQWNTILVKKDETDKPFLYLTGVAAEHARALEIAHWHLSLTHTESYAAALVVAQSKREA